MIVTSISFFIIYTIALGLIVAVGYLLQRTKERNYLNDEQKINIEDLVVLVPFRNEELRLTGLLNSINQLKKQPSKYVFIDDHSTDGSVQLIGNNLSSIDYEVISLPSDVTGKKMALRYATKQTNSQYILTIDADIELSTSYFEDLSQLGDADMYVLPVIMKPKKWLEHFYEIDLLLVTGVNAGLAGLARPIMASGANLLYRRDTFNRVDDIDSHIHAASGDDTYLLRDFRENKTDVRLLTDPKCAITTETPQSFKEFVDQRLRWIGKTSDIKDNLSTGLAVIQAVLTLGFFALLIYSISIANWEILMILLGLKSLTDMVIFYPYISRLGRLSSWLFIPVYELVFPLYTLMILVLLFTYKPKWKGRAIYDRKTSS